MHACLVNNAFILLSAQEYVENLEGCEALADRLARPSQTGQEEVYLNWNFNWYADPNCHTVLKFFKTTKFLLWQFDKVYFNPNPEHVA